MTTNTTNTTTLNPDTHTPDEMAWARAGMWSPDHCDQCHAAYWAAKDAEDEANFISEQIDKATRGLESDAVYCNAVAALEALRKHAYQAEDAAAELDDDVAEVAWQAINKRCIDALATLQTRV